MIIYALLYILIINIITFLIFGIDKWKAKRGRWRIPEFVLLLLAVIGGSVGALVGMHTWHHKTRHSKFMLGIPAILLVQIVVIVLFNLL